jgi:hypothetical protein
MRDALDIDPFGDDHSLGVIEDFTEDDDADDDLFIADNASIISGGASMLSTSSRSNMSNSGKKPSGTWNQFMQVAASDKRDKFDALASDVEEMQKSVHQQEKRWGNNFRREMN